jgi:tetratricopeptide (TPR) repeat protein
MGRCLDDGTVIARLKPENVQMLAAALFVDGSGGDFRKEHVSDIEAIRARISTIDKENVGNINKAVKGEKEHDRFNALPLWKQKQELSTKASSPDEIKLLVEAIELYKQLPVEEQKGEEISTLYRQLGNIYHNNYYPSGSDFKKAIAYYEEALKWNPDSKEANHNLALTYYRLGMYKKAHEYVKKADSIELQDLIETAIKGEGVNEYLVKLAKLHYTATAEKQSEINAKLPDDCPLLKNPANLLNELERTTLLVDLFCKKNNFGHVTGDINSSFIPKADKRSRRIVEKGLIGMETSNIYITYKDFIKLIKYFNAHQASKKK